MLRSIKHVYFFTSARRLLILAMVLVSSLGIGTLTTLAVTHHTTSVQAHAAAPTTPPAQICGNSSLLSGPATPPVGAVRVPAGDNTGFAPVAHTTYWFAPGKHTFGTDPNSQIIPANGDTFIGGPGAILDGQKTNLYAFTQQATGVTIKYLTIQNFGSTGDDFNVGVVNHDSGHNWTITHNTVQHNAGAGVFMGTGDKVTYNCLKENGQYGFSAFEDSSTGVSNIVLDHNEIAGNNVDDWEHRIPGGCGCSGAGKFWITNHANVTNNWSHNNRGPGFWVDTDNNDFDIENNYISNNDDIGLIYEISYNALIKHNTFVRNGLVAGPTNPTFPYGAIYVSESGGDARVAARYHTLRVTENQFTDNSGGVVLWENPGRYCGAGTDGATCTLVNPTKVNANTCVPGKIEHEPYYSDCRWKTQNVSVDHNVFAFNPAHIGSNCTAANDCGFQAIFSIPGTAPYAGTVIEDAITFHRNNVFAFNTYIGPWHFMPYAQNSTVNFATWRAAPYNQDKGSKARAA